MSIQRRGARDLGLKVEWEFAFIGAGTSVEATRDTVFLDVGNVLESGVYDEHGGGKASTGTAQLVLRYPSYAYEHLLGPWIDRADAGQDISGKTVRFTICTHFSPDFDAVVSTHLVRALIENGAFPAYSNALGDYARIVDTGRYALDPEQDESATHPLHMAVLALQNLHGRDNVQVMKRAQELLARVVDDIGTARKAGNQRPLVSSECFYAGQPGVGLWRQQDDWRDVADLLDGDLALWADDMAGATRLELEIPAENSAELVTVPTLFLEKPSQSKLNKYWARRDGGCFFICPYDVSRSTEASGLDEDPVYGRVILSLDPNWVDPASGKKPTLLGLGYALEQAEGAYRTAHGGETRSGLPRYGDTYCTHDDPWYDGRGHDFTIVDSPRSGTRLPYRMIKELTQSPFGKPTINGGTLFVFETCESPKRNAGDTSDHDAWPGLGENTEAFFEACRFEETDPNTMVPLPDALSAKNRAHRIIAPKQTAPVVRCVQLDISPGTPLADVVAWIEAERTEATDHGAGIHVQVAGQLDLRMHSNDPEHIEMLVGRLLGRDRDEVSVPAHGRLNFVGHTLFDGSHETISATNLRQLACYFDYLIQALNSFSRQIARAIDDEGRVYGSARIHSRFVAFQTRFWQYEVSQLASLQSAFSQLCDDAEIGRRFDLVQSEVERLASMANEVSQRRQNWLLFLISFLGITGFVNDIAVLDNASDPSGWNRMYICIGVAIVLSIAFWYVNRGETGADENGS